MHVRRFLVPNVAAGSIIGKAGANITEIQTQSSARMQVRWLRGRAASTSRQGSLSPAASARWQACMRSSCGPQPPQPPLPRALTRPAFCTLQLSKSNEFYPASEDGGQDRILLISGTVNQLLTALHLVLTKLKSEPGALRAVQVRARPGAGSGWAGKGPALPWSCTLAGGVQNRMGMGKRRHSTRCSCRPTQCCDAGTWRCCSAPQAGRRPAGGPRGAPACRRPAPTGHTPALLALQAKDNEELLQLRMLVHARLCGTLIGKGGATIRSFNEDSKATFNISPPPTMPGAGARGGAACLGAGAGRPGLYVGKWVCAGRAWALGGYCRSFEQAPTCGLGLRSAAPGPCLWTPCSSGAVELVPSSWRAPHPLQTPALPPRPASHSRCRPAGAGGEDDGRH